MSFEEIDQKVMELYLSNLHVLNEEEATARYIS